MYQSFTGTSRRTRQVNLSGRSGNPFATAGTTSPKSTVDSAKEDRAKRQHERERITASRQVQRIWRGYASRRKTFAIWRSIWDDTERDISADGSYSSPEVSLRQLNKLLLFFSPSGDSDDSRRLRWYGMRQVSTAGHFACEGKYWKRAYSRLQEACLKSLDVDAKQPDIDETLQILAFAARRTGFSDTRGAIHYYRTLSKLVSPTSDALRHALLAPLGFKESYAGLAVILAQPLEVNTLGLLKDHLDTQLLATELARAVTSARTSRSRIWLLGNVLFLCNTRTPSVAEVVAQLLGTLAGIADFEASPLSIDNATFDRQVLAGAESGFQLNIFLADQLATLVNKDSIRNLLARDSAASSARLYANLALALLRCYPRRADDIRMWLYLGPTNRNEIPATQYFWSAMKSTLVFSTIFADSKSVVTALRVSEAHKDDWIVILIFLELYTFLIKIMDDDQFLGRGSSKRQTAIPIQDVASLVTFLKNLGFTLCFNAAELNADATAPSNASATFGSGSKGRSRPKPILVAGLSGIDVEDLKDLVTGLLRAIYDRDSRRHFLPADHWLMVSHFDMSAFLSVVVHEEERRHLVLEEDEDEQTEQSDDDDTITTAVYGTTPVWTHRLQASRRKRERLRLESVAPRLEMLQNMPFFIPFNTRVQIFREFVIRDQQRRRGGLVDPDVWRAGMMAQQTDGGVSSLARHHAEITRKREFEDAYKQFYDLGPDLKEPIQITFRDKFGLQEAGIDGGGVTKEFLTSVITQAFDPSGSDLGRYFVENDAHLLYPNPTALDDARIILANTFKTDAAIQPFLREILRKYEFLGRIVGKCLYESILVDVSFAGFFLKKWALTGGLGSTPGESGYRASINDLRDFDEVLYRGLLDVKNADDASEYGLTFTVDDMIGPADKRKVVERDLVPGGANIAVTNENRLIYINKLSWYRLQGQSAPQTNAFLKGLSSIIQPSWLSMFNQNELQTLVGGAYSGIDIQDLRQNTQYGGTYVIGDDGQEHDSVKLFWSVMESLADEDRRKVLKFVTSTPRGPLLGFANLNPRFSIRDSGRDENRFPTTSTCVNLLKLPMYKTEATLKRKLLEAINSGAGFDLS